jgi:hypothetical protein
LAEIKNFRAIPKISFVALSPKRARKVKFIFNINLPADWKNGEDVIVVPAVPTDQIFSKFGVEAEIKKPYLRYVPQPN